MRTAFKEWAIVVDALGRGEQIVILRKGGIAEGQGGFQPEQPEFLLFPTLFHQQRESVLPAAQARFDQWAPSLPGLDKVRIEYFARLQEWRRVDALGDAERLRGQHIWRDEIIAQRFDWGKQKNLFALALRIYRLPKPVELPVLESYGGCKSWIELAVDLDVQSARPALNDAEFGHKLSLFQQALPAGDLKTEN